MVPGANDLASFWDNVRSARQSLIPVPASAWDHRLFHSRDRSEPDRTTAELAGFVTDFQFDWRRFRVPPADAAAVNPMQWMVLEAGAQALSGLTEIPKDTTGIILGSTGLGWQPDSGFRIRLDDMLDAIRESEAYRALPAGLRQEALEQTARSLQARLKEVSEDNVVGASASVAAGRLNMHFDLRGPHYSVDAGFASSLAAVDLAVRALRDGELDLAVTGGVSERLGPLELIAFSKLGGLASGGIHPFDARADGTLLGEGAVLFALKRLSDAERDRDRILAVLRGIGGSSDGRGRSLVAPRPEGQALAMRRALEDAGGLSAQSVGYVECHATGTQVGDASELHALRQVYGASPRASIALGSVKANLGHLRSAAGAAGMLRATLALLHGEVPPQASFEQANPRLELEGSPFFVPRQACALRGEGGAPARAAVSAFSFGGNNFHAVLEAWRVGPPAAPVRRSSRRFPEPLAVIGMGGRFPGADDVEGYWRLMQQGVDRTATVPPDRYDIERYVDDSGARADKSYTRLGAFLDALPQPRPAHRIPPNAAATLDPSHVLCLDAAGEALRDASFAPGVWNHDRVAISLAFLPYQGRRFLADLRVHWRVLSAQFEAELIAQGVPEQTRAALLREATERLTRGLPPINEDTLTGSIGSLNAGRIASLHDFHGPHFVVDAACASGLAAVHASAKMLHHGLADVVLTGGVWCDMQPEFFIAACRFNALSAKGSFPFDARADGFIPGEGGGIAILKRLSDAERDGDRIRAVIRGVGGSSDGRGRSVLAPSREGEGQAMRRALESAGVHAASVDYVECHGTGTALGDVTEASAVADVYATGIARTRPIAIGSVKSNIGHLNAAAGVAGLFKAALSVERGAIPATLKVVERNAKLPAELDVVTENRDWPSGPDGGPRRAGVSTFGVGGANFHAIVEAYRPRPEGAGSRADGPRSARGGGEDTPGPAQATARAHARVVAAGGSDASAALRVLERSAAAWVGGQPPVAATSSDPAPCRVAMTASDPAELSRKVGLLRTALTRGVDPGFLIQSGIFVGHADDALCGAPVAITFPGQGGQYANMLRELAAVHPGVRATLDEADAAYVALTGRPLTATFFTDSPAEWTQRDEDIHAGVLAVNVALSRLIRSFGVRPTVYLGQSAGELAALVEAGSLSLADGLSAILVRTRAVLALTGRDPGGMLALACGCEQLGELLEGLPGYAALAADNGPRACIVSADAAAMEALLARSEARGIEATRLMVSHGYHSRLIADAGPTYRAALERLRFSPPHTGLVSTIDGAAYGERPLRDYPAFLTSQFTEPVRLREAFRSAHSSGVRLFLEAGPRWSLTQFARESLQGLPHAACAAIHPKVGELEQFQRLLAFCFVHRVGGLASTSDTGENMSFQQSRTAHSAGFPAPGPGPQPGPVEVKDAALSALLSLPLQEVIGAEAVARMSGALAQRFGVTVAQVPAVADVRSMIDRVAAALAGAGVIEGENQMTDATVPGREALWAALVAETIAKTGYPEEMLEPELELEADLGIDTVKQVAIFAAVRSRFGIERDPNVPLRELGTLSRALAHFEARAGARRFEPSRAPVAARGAPAGDSGPPGPGLTRLGASPPGAGNGESHGASQPRVTPVPQVSAAAPRVPEHGPVESLPAEAIRRAPEAWSAASPGDAPTLVPETDFVVARAVTEERALEVLIGFTVERTGYPAEMLEPDLDLEADLGIDTVRQVDIFARARGVFAVERDPNVPIRELNTLRKVALHLVERCRAHRGAGGSLPPVARRDAVEGHAPAPAGANGAVAAVRTTAGASSPGSDARATLVPDGAPSASHVAAAVFASAPAPAPVVDSVSGALHAAAVRGGAQGGADHAEQVQAALLGMDFQSLGVGHEEVRRLMEALAARLGRAVPRGPLPASFEQLLAVFSGPEGRS